MKYLLFIIWESCCYYLFRKDKLNGSTATTTLYDLSSYILKNDLSQLALGICDIMHSTKVGSAKYPLNRSFVEQGGKTLLHLAVQGNSLATVHCLVMVSYSHHSLFVKILGCIGGIFMFITCAKYETIF